MYVRGARGSWSSFSQRETEARDRKEKKHRRVAACAALNRVEPAGMDLLSTWQGRRNSDEATSEEKRRRNGGRSRRTPETEKSPASVAVNPRKVNKSKGRIVFFSPSTAFFFFFLSSPPSVLPSSDGWLSLDRRCTPPVLPSFVSLPRPKISVSSMEMSVTATEVFTGVPESL